MPRVKPKALSVPPSREALEDGADSTSFFTSNTVATLLLTPQTESEKAENIYSGHSRFFRTRRLRRGCQPRTQT
jgi:hypothetical protein